MRPLTSIRARAPRISELSERALLAIRSRREFLLKHVVPILRRTGLLVPTWRLYERVFSIADSAKDLDERGIAIPPGYLRMLVAGRASVESFLESGRQATVSLRELFREAGLDLDRGGAVLDFGCGCGRVARWWPREAATEWHGCDVNQRLVAWCGEFLPHTRVSVNPLEPPTSYPDGRFDAIYAISVFTHWPEPLQHAWMGELVRLLRPGGRLLFTTHGDAASRAVLLPGELACFERGEFVARFGEDAGSNLCSAFHPAAWVREQLARDVEVVLHRPDGAPGLGNQDVWVVAR